jgi:hypothetical protein
VESRGFQKGEGIETVREPEMIDTERVHLDYVPTRAFREYFLRVFDKQEA